MFARPSPSSFLAAAAIALALLANPALAVDFKDTPSGKYNLEETHGYITFSYSHMGFSNPILKFDDFEVDFDFNRENIEKSSFSVKIRADSINSGVAIFDEHLREKQHFFETKEYPEITFSSKKISQVSKDQFEVAGSLVIKGKSRPVTLKAVVNGAGINRFTSKPTIGVTATGQLKRSDWGLDYAVPAVSDEVDLRIEVELQAMEVKKEAEAGASPAE